MPEPLSQVFVESEIIRLCQLAELVTTEIAERARDAAEADSTYKRVHAQSFLMAQGKTVGDREAVAAIECDAEYTHRRISEARLLAAQEAGRNFRAQLDAMRSINANLRPMVSR